MKFNTKTRYGLRAMIELALDEKNNGMFQKEIAANQNISEKYLDHIISSLKVAGLIKNLKGKKSGYILTEDPGKINIRSIIEAFEPYFSITILDCLKEKDICDNSGCCASQMFWEGLNNQIIDYADSISLKELADKEKKFRSKKDNEMYYI